MVSVLNVGLLCPPGSSQVPLLLPNNPIEVGDPEMCRPNSSLCHRSNFIIRPECKTHLFSIEGEKAALGWSEITMRGRLDPFLGGMLK